MVKTDPKVFHGIVLRLVKYNDRHNILWLYTREVGRISLLVSAGGGRLSVSVRSFTQPLTMVEIVAKESGGGELLKITQIRPTIVLNSLRCDPSKIALTMFIAEFLSLTLTEGEADEPIYNYVCDVVIALERYDYSVANFHLAFLFGLTRPLGISPDFTTYCPGRVFDMEDATFRDAAPLHTLNWLTTEQSMYLALLSRMTLKNSHLFELSRSQRNVILELILRYYTLHYHKVNCLKTLEVLRALYD